MLELLVIVVLAAHLVVADVAMAGPLACLWLNRLAWRGNASADRIGRQLARHSIWAQLATVILGILLLANAWFNETRYVRALEAIPTLWWWYALGELLFSLACMALYVWWAPARRWRWVQCCLPMLSATNLMYHFPPLLVIVSWLASQAEWPSDVIDRPTYRALMLRPEILSVVVHVWVAALAVTGVWVTTLASHARRGAAVLPPDAAAVARDGARLALFATLLQVPIGLWMLVTQSDGASPWQALGETVGVGLLIASVLLSFWLLHFLAAISLNDLRPKLMQRSLALVLLIVLLMSGTLKRMSNSSAHPKKIAFSGTHLKPPTNEARAPQSDKSPPKGRRGSWESPVSPRLP